MHPTDWDNRPFEPKPAKVRDPVCGMDVEPRHSAGTRMTPAGSVFFCSTACLEKFDLNSEHYLQGRELETTDTEATAARRP